MDCVKLSNFKEKIRHFSEVVYDIILPGELCAKIILALCNVIIWMIFINYTKFPNFDSE
jgi:hypothetical protein